MSIARNIAHLLGQNHTATRFVDSADIDNIVSNSTYLNARNLLHNGAMMIDQRNQGSAVTPANTTVTYGPDRWYMYKNTAATFTIEQDTEAPAGFKYSLKATNTGTDSSISFGTWNLRCCYCYIIILCTKFYNRHPRRCIKKS